MLSGELKSYPPNRAIVLRNNICAYCGVILTPDVTQKEHVIGRRFVPKGKLNENWNLIVNACARCNGYKADLENDISAISLFTSVVGSDLEHDQDTVEELQRKAERSISRRTKKPVQDSREEVKFDVPFAPGTNFSFTFTSPPQVADARAFELARLQLLAFFFLNTYQETEKRGWWWPGGFHTLMMAGRSDWGNTVMMDFAQAVLDWEPRFTGRTAEGYYSVCIRRHPDADCWSWAIEWNGSVRLIGFLGDGAVAQAVADKFRPLQMHHQSTGPNSHIRFREEVRLSPEDDRLFDVSRWEQRDGE